MCLDNMATKYPRMRNVQFRHISKLSALSSSFAGNRVLVRMLDFVIERLGVESRQEQQENVLFQSQLCVLTLIRCPFHLWPLLPQWHVKDPGHSARSAGGRLHLNLHTPLTQQSQSGMTLPLSRHSVETYQEMSSHATRQGTLNHNCLSSLSHCGLILA